MELESELDLGSLFAPPDSSAFRVPERPTFLSHFKDSDEKPQLAQSQLKRPRKKQQTQTNPVLQSHQTTDLIKPARRRNKTTAPATPPPPATALGSAAAAPVTPARPAPAARDIYPDGSSHEHEQDSRPSRPVRKQQRIKKDDERVQQAINKVVPFYLQHPQVLSSVVVPMATRQSRLCLRMVNWVVQTYSKRTPLFYWINETGQRFNTKPGQQPGQPPHQQAPHPHKFIFVDIHQSYLTERDKFGKESFAPFRRHERIYLHFDLSMCAPGLQTTVPPFETALCQLTWFRWAWINGVLDYCLEHNDVLYPLWLESKRAKQAAKKMK